MTINYLSLIVTIRIVQIGNGASAKKSDREIGK